MSIEDVGRSGQRKNPKRRRNKMRMAREERVELIKELIKECGLAPRSMTPRLGAKKVDVKPWR
jgi:hypothetical protein